MLESKIDSGRLFLKAALGIKGCDSPTYLANVNGYAMECGLMVDTRSIEQATDDEWRWAKRAHYAHHILCLMHDEIFPHGQYWRLLVNPKEDNVMWCPVEH